VLRAGSIVFSPVSFTVLVQHFPRSIPSSLIGITCHLSVCLHLGGIVCKTVFYFPPLSIISLFIHVFLFAYICFLSDAFWVGFGFMTDDGITPPRAPPVQGHHGTVFAFFV
jgi:hypothetical protein